MKRLKLLLLIAMLPLSTDPLMAEEGKSVVVMDRGIGVPVGSLALPEGYSIRYDVATNPQTGQFDEFFVDLAGPDGKQIRGTGIVDYSFFNNQDPVAISQVLISRGVQDFSSVDFGNFETNEERMAHQDAQRRIEVARAQGMDLQFYAVPFRGIRADGELRGVAEITHTLYHDHSGRHIGGNLNVRLIFAPEESFAQAKADAVKVDAGFHPNPQHGQMVSQLVDQQTARMTREHQQRMAAQQQAFEAHQQKMQGIYRANEAHNQAWREQFNRGWNTGSSGSGYTHDDAFRDTVVGQTAFDDPYTGDQIRRDGHYNHWFTDGQGNYQGSDDPNFNPGSGWQSIEPLSP